MILTRENPDTFSDSPVLVPHYRRKISQTCILEKSASNLRETSGYHENFRDFSVPPRKFRVRNLIMLCYFLLKSFPIRCSRVILAPDTTYSMQ